MKKAIKVLYQKDPTLAHQVAKVLGFKIIAKKELSKKNLQKKIKDTLQKELGVDKLGKEYEEWNECCKNLAEKMKCICARWYKTFTVHTSYGTYDVDVFVNPTSKDLRSIVNATGSNIVRLLATDDKKLYVWRGNVVHHYMVRLLPRKNAARFEGVIKNGKLSIIDSDYPVSVVKQNWSWIRQYADVPYIDEPGFTKSYSTPEEIGAENNITSEKDPTKVKIISIVKSILGFIPKKVKFKQLGDNVYYQVGKLVEEENENQQIIIKIVNKNGEWSYVVGVPNVGTSEDEEEAFLRAGKASTEEEIFEKLANSLKQAKNFIKSRNIKLNQKGEFV